MLYSYWQALIDINNNVLFYHHTLESKSGVGFKCHMATETAHIMSILIVIVLVCFMDVRMDHIFFVFGLYWDVVVNVI